MADSASGVPAPTTSDAADPETFDAGDVTLHRRREFVREIDPEEHEGMRVPARVLASRALLTGIQDGRSDSPGTRPMSKQSDTTTPPRGTTIQRSRYCFPL